ncbi:hypothetical protein Lser_V15G06069 [Lactuca serriola]
MSKYLILHCYAVLLIEKKDEEGKSHVLSAALEIAEGETLEVDAKYRALVAIRSLMVEGVVKKIAMDFDVESVATSTKASKDLKVAQVGADICHTPKPRTAETFRGGGRHVQYHNSVI